MKKTHKTNMKKTHKTFHFHIKLEVSNNWIEDGTTSVSIKDRLQEFLEEELNPFSIEGEYIVTIK